MEIVFNYIGRMQQLERADTLLQQTDFALNEGDGEKMSDMGPDTPRFALFEISAAVLDNKLQFTFMFNRRIKQADRIPTWMTECKRSLEEMVVQSAAASREPTLSDYPLMSLTYNSLRKLQQKVLPAAGINHCDEVEDIYPCSAVQEGILISQLRDPDLYNFHFVMKVKHGDPGHQVNGRLLGEAWQMVVDRHGALRTFFTDSVCDDETFDQVVLKNANSGVRLVECDDEDVTKTLQSTTLREKNRTRNPPSPHQLTICSTTKGNVFIKLEMNHAVVDGSSMPALMRDLAAAYENRLDDGKAPLYKDYIRYIRGRKVNASVDFWKNYLRGTSRSYFPRIRSEPPSSKSHASVRLHFGRFAQLRDICEKSDITLANMMHSAWALVLREYIGCDDVCFGYLTMGRDAPVKDVQDMVGVFINMLCCRVQFTPELTVAELLRSVQDKYLESLPSQHCSLAQVQHDLGMAGKPMYNTTLTVQNHSRSRDAPEEKVVFESVTGSDPTEVKKTPLLSPFLFNLHCNVDFTDTLCSSMLLLSTLRPKKGMRAPALDTRQTS